MLKQLLSQTKWVSAWVFIHFIVMLSGGNNQAADSNDQIKQSDRTSQISTIQAPQNPMNNEPKLVTQIQPEPALEPEPESVRVSYKYKPDLNHDLQKYVPVEVVATGYYAGKESTGKTKSHPDYGITYSGVKVVRDEKSFSTIAADPKVFPIGSVLYIPGYGYGIVADTGSAIKGKKIDLYFETKDQVYREWGKKKLNIFLVKKGEGKLDKTIWNESEIELFPVANGNKQPARRVNGNPM
ncbi:3D domain-containing protein [Paenibacillus albiflavus]